MKWIKTTGLVAVALSMLALSAGTAEAQYTPTLTLTVNGSAVTIEVSPIAGAHGYTIQAGTSPTSANIGTVNIPASITKGVVTVPDGTYYLRVRAFAGSLQGPWSSVASVTVGGCSTAPLPPVATFTVAGPSVTVNWDAVGASAYAVDFGLTPGAYIHRQVVGAGTTSFTQYVPQLGTFYARVVAGNVCGQSASNEVAFTITDLNGGGYRTPDPAPGQMLPIPSYGESVAEGVANQYPGDLRNACGSRMYLYRLVNALRKRDSRWGLNWKRGWNGSLSTDIVTYNGTNLPDNQASKIYLVDVVSGICESNGFAWNWHETTEKTWAARGSSECGSEWCAKWTIDPYLAAGFPP